MSDMVLSGVLLWRGALSSQVARVTTVEAGVAPAVGGAGRHGTGGGGGRALGAACWCWR
jgi:hypothetical protein